MKGYIVHHLLEFCGSGCGALVTSYATAGQCEKAAEVVDDSRQFGVIALIQGTVQGTQISPHQTGYAV